MKIIIFLIFFMIKCCRMIELLNELDNFLNKELYLGVESAFNTTKEDCVWRPRRVTNRNRPLCQKDVRMYFYANDNSEVRLFNPTDVTWLQSLIAYNSTRENVLFVHGYGSGKDTESTKVIKEALQLRGDFNLFLIDYTGLSPPPCYVAMVNNIHFIGQCLVEHLNRLFNNVQTITSCIGHSMGAHICGLLGKSPLLQFKLDKIVALDPALPFVFGDIQLIKSDARTVYVLQTNAGYYGDIGPIGHVNVCINDGYIQPYCHRTDNPNLCSHLWSICYMSQILFSDMYPMYATKSNSFCPNAGVFRYLRSNNFDKLDIIDNSIIETEPLGTKHFSINDKEIISFFNNNRLPKGNYCYHKKIPPFCPDFLNGFGHINCCEYGKML